jgi:hypothetical protein
MDPLWLMNLTEPMEPQPQPQPQPQLTPVGAPNTDATLTMFTSVRRRQRRFPIHSIGVGESGVRVYGAPMEPNPDRKVDIGAFQLEMYQGYTGKEGIRAMGGRLTWNRPQAVPRDRVYCIHLFVDVSGSMGSRLRASMRTRSNIISDSMKKMTDILIPLLEKGMKFHLSLHTFSSECKQVFPSTPVTKEFLESQDWNRHFEPTHMTNLWGAARVAKELRETEPEFISGLPTESSYILMSDGMDTIGDESLCESVFDVALGIGTSAEYDPTILRTISHAEIEACPNETALSTTLLRHACKSYMNLATDVELNVGSGAI